MMEGWKERLIAEREAIDARILALEAFRGIQAYRQLPVEERDRLTTQLMIMRMYAEILRQRMHSAWWKDSPR